MLSEHEGKQLGETLAGVHQLRTDLAVLVEKVAGYLKLQDELRTDLYGGEGQPGIKSHVQGLLKRCDERCPTGAWAFFCPIVQSWITWAVIGATAAVVYLIFLHPIITAATGAN
jgi:hypothetical protein